MTSTLFHEFPDTQKETVTLRSMLGLFPSHRTSNSWPGLRVGTRYNDYRVILSVCGDYGIVKGLKGTRARTEYGQINLDTGKVTCHNEELNAMLVSLWRDPVGFCDEFGKKWRHCCFCGVPIVTDDSLQYGYGPVCAKRFGLPWGS